MFCLCIKRNIQNTHHFFSASARVAAPVDKMKTLENRKKIIELDMSGMVSTISKLEVKVHWRKQKKKIASVVSLINKTRLQRVNPQSLAGPISSSCLHLPLYIYNVSFFLKASEWVLYRCVIFSNLRNNITNTTHPCLDPTWNLKQLFLRNLESL